MEESQTTLWPTAQQPLFEVEEKRVNGRFTYMIFGFETLYGQEIPHDRITLPVLNLLRSVGRSSGALWIVTDYDPRRPHSASNYQYSRGYLQEKGAEWPNGTGAKSPVFVLDPYAYGFEYDDNCRRSGPASETIDRFSDEDIPDVVLGDNLAMCVEPFQDLYEAQTTLMSVTMGCVKPDGRLDSERWLSEVLAIFSHIISTSDDGNFVVWNTMKSNVWPEIERGLEVAAASLKQDPWFIEHKDSLKWNAEDKCLTIDGRAAGSPDTG